MIIIGKGMIKIVGRFTLIQNDPRTNNYNTKRKMRDFTTSSVLLYLLIHWGDLILLPIFSKIGATNQTKVYIWFVESCLCFILLWKIWKNEPQTMVLKTGPDQSVPKNVYNQWKPGTIGKSSFASGSVFKTMPRTIFKRCR